jgi:hypothetical protein
VAFGGCRSSASLLFFPKKAVWLVGEDSSSNSAAKLQHRHCGFRMFGHFFSKYFYFFVGTKNAVILVIWSFGQNRFCVVKIRHYKYKYIFIFIVNK